MHLQINYLYRDASNYKNYASVVIEAPDNTTAKTIEEALRTRFLADQVWPDILHFRPEELDWPTAYFDDYDDEEDLDLHELESIEATNAPVTAALTLSV